MPSELMECSGHLLDSWTLPRTWDVILHRGGNLIVEDMRAGRTKADPSYARLTVEADDDQTWELIISELQPFGAVLLQQKDVQTAPVEQNGVLPATFYSTTNLPTEIRLCGPWVPVEHIEMEVAILVDRQQKGASGKPMQEVRLGEAVVLGHDGIRLRPLERARQRAREHEVFAFMQSRVSSEQAKGMVIGDIARQMQQTRAQGGKILFVLGPAVIQTGAGHSMAELIRRGSVQVMFGGNAIITHDIESVLFGTSLGVDVASGEQVEGGHRHHLRAINTMRAHGSVEQAIEAGVLNEGITYEALKHHVTMVLAGSVRDDGPMPGVIDSMQLAQHRMREALQGVDLAMIVATMLHAIATGNLLPATVRTVVVDSNPAVVTKLSDRGSFQAAALITDAALFLRA